MILCIFFFFQKIGYHDGITGITIFCIIICFAQDLLDMIRSEPFFTRHQMRIYSESSGRILMPKAFRYYNDWELLIEKPGCM